MELGEVTLLEEFHDQIRCFFQALDKISQYWGLITGDDDDDNLGKCYSYTTPAYEAWKQIEILVPKVVMLISPPANQSETQFLASLQNHIYKAWHACRFLHCVRPDKEVLDEDMKIIQKDLRQLSVLRNRIWEDWRHIGYTIELEKAKKGENTEGATDLEIKTEPKGIQSKPSNKSKRNKPGRKGRSEEEKRADNVFLEEWKQARKAKIRREVFVKDWTLIKGSPTKIGNKKTPAMTVSDLEKVQDRVRTAEERSS